MRKRGLFFTTIAVLILGVANIYLFINKADPSYKTVTGQYSIDFPNLPLGINLSIIAFIIQWIILLSILFFAYSKFLRSRKHEDLKLIYGDIKTQKSRASTDLDFFYKILKDKKNLSVGSIAEFFEIPKEKALEWAKILENHELVIIEYPAFSDPEVRLNEKESERQNEGKAKKVEPQKGKEEQKPKNTASSVGVPQAPQTFKPLKTLQQNTPEQQAAGKNKPGKEQPDNTK